MTNEDFKSLKVGDIVYAEIIKLNEWHLCYVVRKSEYSAELMDTTLMPQKDNTYLCRSSVTRAPEEIKNINFFIENNLIRDNDDGWSLKYQINIHKYDN